MTLSNIWKGTRYFRFSTTPRPENIVIRPELPLNVEICYAQNDPLVHVVWDVWTILDGGSFCQDEVGSPDVLSISITVSSLQCFRF